MPFTKVQAILKRILPEKYYQSLYNMACNGWDVYQKVADNTFFVFPFMYYYMLGNREKLERVIIVQKTLPYTMCSKVGMEATYDICESVVKQMLKGAFVECGVARGGSSALMALVARDEKKNRGTWLFDSFEGLPKQSELDGEQKPVRHKDKTANDLAEGYCLGSYRDVSDLLFKRLGLDYYRVFMVKGWFQDTLPQSREIIGDIAVLRLDGDWYESTKCCLENLYDKVVFGGYVIIDDYTLKGCRLAVDEFRAKKGLESGLFLDANGRGYWRR